MARTPIATDTIYHVYNRGVDKRNVFTDDGDYLRFIHYLYQCNNVAATPNLTFHLANLSALETPPDQLLKNSQPRNPLVDIFSFALMPNHFHLMLKERVAGGISNFMQKLGTGHTMFFNEKYQRSGSLFQGSFKYKAVLNDAQLLYLPHYIHLNPLPITCGSNLGGSTSLVVERLLLYRWSSLRDYASQRNFPSIISTSFILEQHGSNEAYMIDLKRAMKKPNKLSTALEDVAIDPP